MQRINGQERLSILPTNWSKVTHEQQDNQELARERISAPFLPRVEEHEPQRLKSHEMNWKLKGSRRIFRASLDHPANIEETNQPMEEHQSSRYWRWHKWTRSSRVMPLRARTICNTLITLPLRIYIPRVANSTQYSTRGQIHINRLPGRSPIKLQGW